jgi:anti-anti-sigma regulatory factor
MWKIQKLQDAECVVLGLSGRIQGEQLMELRNLLAAEARTQNVVLDLKEVKLVDQDAVTFLASQETSGTTLRNCPAYIREWIDRNGE